MGLLGKLKFCFDQINIFLSRLSSRPASQCTNTVYGKGGYEGHKPYHKLRRSFMDGWGRQAVAVKPHQFSNGFHQRTKSYQSRAFINTEEL